MPGAPEGVLPSASGRGCPSLRPSSAPAARKTGMNLGQLLLSESKAGRRAKYLTYERHHLSEGNQLLEATFLCWRSHIAR